MKLNELLQKRVEKYMEKVSKNPCYRDQLLIKNGSARMTLQGEDEKCTFVEGYIKTSESDELVSIKDGVYSFFILPKDKMIILHGENCEEYEFLGYKSENTKGCFMIIHAVTEQDDVLIVKIDDEVPVFISIDECYEVENFNTRIYQMLRKLLMQIMPDSIKHEVENVEVEDDEWE